MARTLYLDPATWDLVIDASGTIASAVAPYQLAQDAATAISTFLGEVYYNTTLGVPYFQQILGRVPTLALLKAQFTAAALSVTGVVAAQVFITSMDSRIVSGQVHVTDSTGATSFANF